MILQLLATANGQRPSACPSDSANITRAQAARGILQRYAALNGSGRAGGRVSENQILYEQYFQLSEAYIELADLPKQEQPTGTENTLTSKLRRVRWTSAESRVAVPTCKDPSAIDAPRVGSFKPIWIFPGGITRPKKIVCIPADGGLPFTQLVKGEDPRADSTISQLFRVVNILLRGDRACRRRNLEVQMYRVIPLHPKAGLIEWVANAQSIGSIIIGVDGNGGNCKLSLRARYDPAGWAHNTCMNRLKDPQNAFQDANRPQGPSNDQDVAKLEKLYQSCRVAFEEVLNNTRPVMRHYFFDRSSSAPAWFLRRLAFTRSVAASSMAGYIVGLGDRHTSNILVLDGSGEILHIDLGVVFDQGLFLSLPEKVPFRLTREIVDGMGPAGTTGVFTRCSEETLRVLRFHRQALLAVFDVLIYDPLTAWKLSSSKKASVQRRGLSGGSSSTRGRRAAGRGSPLVESASARGRVDEEMGDDEDDACLGVGSDAQHVRNRVREKLEGWDRGGHLSVEGQVKNLIIEAQSFDNLAYLYRGWVAWM